MVNPSAIKKTLDAFYMDYDFKGRIKHDPIEFPHRYKYRNDIEVSGFIASSFAYGKVELFKPVIGKILSIMGKSPYDFLMGFNPDRHRKKFSGIKYRFNDTDDIVCLLYILSVILNRHGTIEDAFKSFYKDGDPDIGSALTGMMNYINAVNTTPVYGRAALPRGFFPTPQGGSACKRANLFLRWMIRDRDIDFGIWKKIPKNKLVIPLDTHIARISRCLGFTRRKSAGWKAALEITEALKRLDPEDPLKYDFALCHQGISGLCRPDGKGCRGCGLKGHSKAAKHKGQV